jgi:membrane protein implicated in regulation of membrane protease activity
MTLAFLLLAAEAAGDVPVLPVIILMALGIAVAIFGHLYGSRAVVGMGIFLLFLATAAMVLGGFLAFQGDETDPRPPENPSTPDF